MGKLRHRYTIFLLTLVLTACAWAQSNLTQIRDTIYNANGTPFNGTVVITWVGFSTPTSGSVSPLSTSARIYNGALSVLLVPSTTASAGSYYQAVYYSSDGTTSWTETWSVPPSTNALSVSGVRTSTTAGASSGSGSGTTSGSGSSGPTSSGSTQYATLPIAISQVTGLSTDLNTLNTNLTSLTNTVTTNGNTLSSLNSTVSGLSSSVTTNSNSISSLQSSVSGLSSNLSGVTATVNTNTSNLSSLTNTVSTLSSNVTNLNSTVSSLQSSSGTTISFAFVDGETPGGTVNGTNTAFTLSQTPYPAASLDLYRNGLIQTSGVDYTLSGAAVTFLSGNIPMTGDILQAYYRVQGTSTAPLFADAEIPTGTINGTNTVFTLAFAPNPALSLRLYKNGVLMSQTGDYTIGSKTITFVSNAIPQSGDTLTAYYRH